MIAIPKITKICEHLPRSKNGKIKISDFINLPILSEEAFQAIDRYVSEDLNQTDDTDHIIDIPGTRMDSSHWVN